MDRDGWLNIIAFIAFFGMVACAIAAWMEHKDRARVTHPELMCPDIFKPHNPFAGPPLCELKLRDAHNASPQQLTGD